jgi:Ca2+/Na+ antiporter
VRLLSRGGVLVCENSFSLKQKNKKLYFTIYIDDVGKGGYVNQDGLRWFEENKYPVNFGWQGDESGGKIPLKVIKEKYDLSFNYLFHHFHAYNYTGSALLYNIDKIINWYRIHKQINDSLSDIFKRRVYLRDKDFFIILFAALTLCVLFYIKKRKTIFAAVAIFFSATTILFLIACLSAHHKHNDKNWTAHFNDPAWCKSFLLDIRKEFDANNLSYPRITRHGWNIPLNGIMEFYMKEMGVLADATAIDGLEITFNKHNAYVKTKWPNASLPYYASITKGFETAYNSKEEDRGVLEIPLNFSADEYSQKGFLEKHKKNIDALPNGALVSTFCHPYFPLKKYKPLISFLRKNYDVDFVNADAYLKLYMKHYPRPVLIDIDDMAAYWAYYDGKELKKICPAECVNISSDKAKKYTININTYSPLPMLEIFTSHGEEIMWNGVKYKFSAHDKKRSVIFENIANGSYCFELGSESMF